MYTILVTESFLNDLLKLPNNVSKNIPKKVRILEQDPISAEKSAKKIRDKIYRIRIGDYRLIYAVGKNTVKLLAIGHRSEIYKNHKIQVTEIIVLENEDEDEEFPDNAVDENESDGEEESITRFVPINDELLKQCKIPENNWEMLKQIQTEDELINAPIENHLLNRLLDALYPRSLNKIIEQPEYIVGDVEYLSRYEGELTSFLLHLDPEQERLLDLEIDEPILVRGGPGTGKSVMAVYHIKKLVEQGIKGILLATHSSSFRAYAEQLLQKLLGEDYEEKYKIEIRTVQSLIGQFYGNVNENPRYPSIEEELSFLNEAIQKVKEKGHQSIRDFYWKNLCSKILKLGVYYILEEIKEVVESCCLNEKEYLKLDRKGRGSAIGINERKFLWKVAQTWRQILKKEGYISYGQRSETALSIASSRQHKRYNYLILDEAQDVSPIDFRFLLELIVSKNNVYITADEAQSIYRRGFTWQSIYKLLRIRRILNLNCNYRSTEQISAACGTILENVNDNPSKNQGDLPEVVTVESVSQEAQVIKDFFIRSAKKYRVPLSGAAVLCPSQKLAREYAEHLTALQLIAKYVTAGDVNIEAPYIKVLTFTDAKGLEFPLVAIAGMRSGIFPYGLEEISDDAEREIILAQQKRTLYVACSRAMKALMITKILNHSSEFEKLLREPLWEQKEY